ncbi:hypothetical protein [Caballeronia sp. ATUFL_M1_KS5A]|uniref:hypothetical protein n=1 Tax=Caballeronia sp. ATUFL_M1_KS5A TaxID=2921778 RepID=UPI0020288A3A|nr:hypothetical protein [Caballeronia sp. ATUFL_M1_KS5A]
MSNGARELIVKRLRRTILALDRRHVQDIDFIAVARHAQRKLESGKGTLVERYGFLQFIMTLARDECGRNYSAESNETAAIQGDMFTGVLQRRYPLPHKRGDVPVYRLLEHLTPEQVRWNAEQHRKVGHAHLRHAEALEDYADSMPDCEAS